MVSSYNTRTGRGPNQILAHAQRLESADKSRWATGRNVKVSVGYRLFDAVEVWALKHRVDGKVVVVATHRDRAAAEAWVAGQEIK